MAIDPRGSDLKRLLAEDDGGPLVMLNLLRFTDGGREKYADYAQLFVERIMDRYGAELLYYGDGSTVLAAEPGWDAAATRPGRANPTAWRLLELAMAIGLPFLVLSASAPVLQSWFAGTTHPREG